MTKKTAFWIFLLGTLSSTVLFLGLSIGVAALNYRWFERPAMALRERFGR